MAGNKEEKGADKTDAKEETKTVAKPAATGVASLAESLAADAETFKEHLGKDDIAIPFLYMIQTMTPYANKAKPEYDKKFEPGFVYDNATMTVYEKPRLIFCAYAACYLEWQPNRGGFAGRYSNAEGMNARTVRNDNGEDIIQEGSPVGTPGNSLSFTHEHAVLVLNEDGSMMQAILSMSSTQVKHSKKLNRAISMVVNENKVIMPRFYTVFEASSVIETNGDNSWFSWQFKPVANLLELGDQADAVYNAAREFALAMQEGNASVDYNKSETIPSGSGAGDDVDGSDEDIPF